MIPTRGATASVLVAALFSVGLAAPAQAADPNALGTYTFEADDGEVATWEVTPCTDDTEHCVRVSETGNSKRQPWSANAYWTVGSWVMFVDQPDAVLCVDGSSAPGRNTYSWDASALTGNASIFVGDGACGIEPQVLNIPFGLAKISGPPLPAGPAEVPPPAPPPYVVDIPPPYEPNTLDTQAVESAPAPAMPAEATPSIPPPPSDELTEAEVAEPGFNAGRR